MLVGSGNVQRKIYNVTDSDTTIDSIHIDGTVDVRLAQTQEEDNEFKIEVETDENLHYTDAIQISVNNRNNCLSVKDHNCQYTKMIVYIQFSVSQNLKHLNLNGTGSVQSTNQIATDFFTVVINGTRKVGLKLEARTGLDLEMNGTSQLLLSGSVQQASVIKQSGTTELNAKECKMSRISAVLRGTSLAYVVAQDEINVEVQDISQFFYRGPLKKKIVGAITCKVQEF